MAAKSSNKDKQMAAHLKAIGDERRTGICVICGRIVANANTYAHISAHARGAGSAD